MTKEAKLKALIKEELHGILKEALPRSRRIDVPPVMRFRDVPSRRAPESDDDWGLMHDAARPHLQLMLSAIGKMVSDEADSFEDTLSRHYGLEFNDAKEFLMRELSTLLGHKSK